MVSLRAVGSAADGVGAVAKGGVDGRRELAACQAICSDNTETTGPADPAAGLTAC
jgi:hypothetical protein